MKKFLVILMCVMLLGIACKKQDVNSEGDNDNNMTVDEGTDDSSSEDTSMSSASELYVKYSSWFYKNDGDLGKAAKDVTDKKLLEFGNKVTVLKSKKSGDKEYFQIQLPDKSKYWGEKSDLVEKLITINQPDVECYKQPDESFVIRNVKLQPGDFFYYVGEQDGFYKLSSICSLPRGKDNDVVWLGEFWIKQGFTDDPFIAKDSYRLALAYYQLYNKKDKEKALEMMKKILEDGPEGDLENVIQNVINELEAGN